ncbi:MAG: hypothetical protein KJP07_14220 [Desulfatitalea sp.]|nr:hypothetical protein [Desulfatitalea sp.]
MEVFNENYIESLTRFNRKKREELVRYYAALPEEGRLFVHDYAGRFAARNRDRIGKRKSEFYYAVFLIGIAKVRYIEKKKDRKEKLSEFDSVLAKQINIARIDTKFREKSKKPSPLKAKIERKYFEMIHKFRTADYPQERRSWRWIVRYLSDIHKFKVSYSYLIRCYEEILEEKSLDGSV